MDKCLSGKESIPEFHNPCCIHMYFSSVWIVWVPQKVLVTHFPNIFHIKTEWYIVYKYLKTKTLSRDTNILSQMQ